MNFSIFKKGLIHVVGLIKKNKLLFVFSSLIDLGCIIAFLYAFWQIVYGKIFQILLGLSEMMKGMQNVYPDLEAQAASYKALAASVEFMRLYSSLTRWLFIFVLVVFLLWVVFQGVNFFLVARMIDRKTKFWKYLGKFALFSLFFYIFEVLSFWLTIYLSMLNSKMIVQVFSQGLVNVVFVILLVVIYYFCLMSLVIMRKRKIITAFIDTFKIGVTKILKVLLAYFSVVVGLVIFLLVTYLLFNLNIVLFYLGFLLLLVPSISFFRILFFHLIEKIK